MQTMLWMPSQETTVKALQPCHQTGMDLRSSCLIRAGICPSRSTSLGRSASENEEDKPEECFLLLGADQPSDVINIAHSRARMKF